MKLTVTVSLIASILCPSAALAATDTIFKYTEPKTGSFSINPMAMSPDSDDVDYFINYGGSTLKSSNVGCSSTGINLPHGSTITSVRAAFTRAAHPQNAKFE